MSCCAFQVHCESDARGAVTDPHAGLPHGLGAPAQHGYLPLDHGGRHLDAEPPGRDSAVTHA